MPDNIQMGDIRETPLYDHIKQYFNKALGPAFGKVSAALESLPSPAGDAVAFSGQIRPSLDENPFTRICIARKDHSGRDWKWNEPKVNENEGHHSEMQPRFSPDGKYLAFLSDHRVAGSFQLQIRDESGDGATKEAPSFEGSIELLRWSSDSSKILCLVAENGASQAGAKGSGNISWKGEEKPSWIPTVVDSRSREPGRNVYIYNLHDNQVSRGNSESFNVWEAEWCGQEHMVAIVSDLPGEDDWYNSRVSVIDLKAWEEEVLYTPKITLEAGFPKANGQGTMIAFVEAHCSDRGGMSGDLVCLNRTTGTMLRPDTKGVNITSIEWIGFSQLFYFGIRNMTPAAGIVDFTNGEANVRETWSAEDETTCPGAQPDAVYPTREEAISFPIVLESFAKCPRLVMVRPDGESERIAIFETEGTQWLESIRQESRFLRWNSLDGLPIHGLLRLPRGASPPYPLITMIHGGPVGGYRNMWNMAEIDGLFTANGFAVFMPNPRGSCNRGLEYASKVMGDMGGAEVHDTLTGIDYLVEQGIADRSRLAVMGRSHGGFMTNWIVTQTDRFAAAVAVSPVSDWFSFYTTSNNSAMIPLFLKLGQDSPRDRFAEKSPVQFAGTYKTPVMQTAGAYDECTPPEQAIQYHRTMIAKGRPSVCVTYPEEGHGVRKWPTYIDYCTRILGWFEYYLNENGKNPAVGS